MAQQQRRPQRGGDIQELLLAVATSSPSSSDDEGAVAATARPVQTAITDTQRQSPPPAATIEGACSDIEDDIQTPRERSGRRGVAFAAGHSLSSVPSTTGSLDPTASAAAAARRRRINAMAHSSDDDDDDAPRPPPSTRNAPAMNVGAESVHRSVVTTNVGGSHLVISESTKLPIAAAVADSPSAVGAADAMGAQSYSAAGSAAGGALRTGSRVHAVSASRRQELQALQLSDDSDEDDDRTFRVRGTASSMNTTAEITTPYMKPAAANAVADLRGEALVVAIEEANANYRRGGTAARSLSSASAVSSSSAVRHEVAASASNHPPRMDANHAKGHSGGDAAGVHTTDELASADVSAVVSGTHQLGSESAPAGGGVPLSGRTSAAASTTSVRDFVVPPSGAGAGGATHVAEVTDSARRSSATPEAVVRAPPTPQQPQPPPPFPFEEDHGDVHMELTSSTAMSPSPKARGDAPTRSAGGAIHAQTHDESTMSFLQEDIDNSLLDVSGIPPTAGRSVSRNAGATTTTAAAVSQKPVKPTQLQATAKATTPPAAALSSSATTRRQPPPISTLSTAAIARKNRQQRLTPRAQPQPSSRPGSAVSSRRSVATTNGAADSTVTSIQFELDDHGSPSADLQHAHHLQRNQHHAHHSSSSLFGDEDKSLVFSPAPADLTTSSSLVFVGTGGDSSPMEEFPSYYDSKARQHDTQRPRQLSPPPEAHALHPQPHRHTTTKTTTTTTVQEQRAPPPAVVQPCPTQQRSSSSSSAMRHMYDQAVRARTFSAAKVAQMRTASANAEMRECSFAPKITAKGARAMPSAKRRSTSDRAEEAVSSEGGVVGAEHPEQKHLHTSEQRQRLLHEARGVEKDAALAECTFAPRVEPISAALVQRARAHATAGTDVPFPSAAERLHLDSKRRAVELAHNAELSLRELRGSRPQTKRTEEEILSHVESLQKFQQKREETILRLAEAEHQRHTTREDAARSKSGGGSDGSTLLVDPDAVVHRLLHRPAQRNHLEGSSDESAAAVPHVNVVSRELALRRRETLLSEWFAELSGGVHMQTRGVDVAELDLVALFSVVQNLQAEDTPPLHADPTSTAPRDVSSSTNATQLDINRSASSLSLGSPPRQSSQLGGTPMFRSPSSPGTAVGAPLVANHAQLRRRLATLRHTAECRAIVSALLEFQRDRPTPAAGAASSSWWLTFAQFRAVLNRVEHRSGPQLWSRRGPQQASAEYLRQHEDDLAARHTSTVDSEAMGRVFQRLHAQQTCATWQKHKRMGHHLQQLSDVQGDQRGDHTSSRYLLGQQQQENTSSATMVKGAVSHTTLGSHSRSMDLPLESHKVELLAMHARESSDEQLEERDGSGSVDANSDVQQEGGGNESAAAPTYNDLDGLLDALDRAIASRQQPSSHHDDEDSEAPFASPASTARVTSTTPLPPGGRSLERVAAAATAPPHFIALTPPPLTMAADLLLECDAQSDLLLECARTASTTSSSLKKERRHNTTLSAQHNISSSNVHRSAQTQRRLELVESSIITATTTTVITSTPAESVTTHARGQRNNKDVSLAASSISAREQRLMEEKRRLRALGRRLAAAVVSAPTATTR